MEERPQAAADPLIPPRPMAAATLTRFRDCAARAPRRWLRLRPARPRVAALRQARAMRRPRPSTVRAPRRATPHRCACVAGAAVHSRSVPLRCADAGRCAGSLRRGCCSLRVAHVIAPLFAIAGDCRPFAAAAARTIKRGDTLARRSRRGIPLACHGEIPSHHRRRERDMGYALDSHVNPGRSVRAGRPGTR